MLDVLYLFVLLQCCPWPTSKVGQLSPAFGTTCLVARPWESPAGRAAVKGQGWGGFKSLVKWLREKSHRKGTGRNALHPQHLAFVNYVSILGHLPHERNEAQYLFLFLAFSRNAAKVYFSFQCCVSCVQEFLPFTR